jgi:hypothetical protein
LKGGNEHARSGEDVVLNLVLKIASYYLVLNTRAKNKK